MHMETDSSTPFVSFQDPSTLDDEDAIGGPISQRHSLVKNLKHAGTPIKLERAASTIDGDRYSFRWNGRNCTGNAFHKAVLACNFEVVRELTDINPDMVRSRFQYLSGEARGSGEAIHLAASKGKLEMVKLLLEKQSDANASVELDQKYHYSVIHAAVYAEGFGGHVDMAKFLFKNKAEPKANKDGVTVVHLAYQTSHMELIKYIQDKVPLDSQIEDCNPPLQIAIDRKKMRKRQLAEVAPLTSSSLRLFIHKEPGCVHHFLDRARSAGDAIEDLGMLLQTEDVLRVLHDSKQSAANLLDLLRIEAKATDPGHHPLPSRMSFKETNYFRSIRLLNPPKALLSTYQPDKQWTFDSERFKAPPWHDDIISLKEPPIPDVDVSVSLTPNLLCPEFFGTLLGKSASSIKGEDDILIFENLTVKAAINEVWWGGTFSVEIAQFILTLTGLIALVQEAHFLEEASEGETHVRADSVAVAFVGSRAWLELLHKVLQFAGAHKAGAFLYNVGMRDVSEMICCLTQMLFSHHPDNRWLHVLVILIYWVRMLEVNFAANLMRELLPILRLGRDLVPSVAVSCIFFAAFTHILYVLEPGPLSDIIYHSFCLLIKGTVANDPSSDLLNLLFTYASQLLFTIFLLNVFIGVIGENYASKKERAYLISQEQRSVKCMEYLFVARCVPTAILSKRVAFAVKVGALLANVGMQMRGTGSSPLFFVCQLLQLFGAYQVKPKCAWARGWKLNLLHDCDFYLWSFTPVQENDVVAAEEKAVEQKTGSADHSPNFAAKTKFAVSTDASPDLVARTNSAVSTDPSPNLAPQTDGLDVVQFGQLGRQVLALAYCSDSKTPSDSSKMSHL